MGKKWLLLLAAVLLLDLLWPVLLVLAVVLRRGLWPVLP